MKLYDRRTKLPGSRNVSITYFHGLSWESVGRYFNVPLKHIEGQMTPEGFQSASAPSAGLRFKTFRSGLETSRYTLMVGRQGSRMNFD